MMTKEQEAEYLNTVFYLPGSITDKIKKLPDGVNEIESRKNSKHDLICDWSGQPNEALSPVDGLFFKNEEVPFDHQLVSSEKGRITKVLMTYPSYSKGYTINRDYLEDLLLALPEADFFIFSQAINPEAPVTMDDLDPDKGDIDVMAIDLLNLQQNDSHTDRQIYFLYADDLSSISIWVEDPFLALTKKDDYGNTSSVYLMEPYNFQRKKDKKIADKINENSNTSPVELNQARVGLYFQGGNTLVGDDFVLVGKEYAECTSKYLKSCRPENWDVSKYICSNSDKHASTVQYLYQYAFGCKREVIITGTEKAHDSKRDSEKIDLFTHRFNYGNSRFQPLVHIDLFITLVGRLEEDGVYYILVGEPFNASGKSFPKLDTLYFNPLKSRMDEIALQLENTTVKGQKNYFKIIRNPLPIIKIDNRDKEYLWRPLSYNNCLVENTKAKRRVLMPTYGTVLKHQLELKELNENYLKPYDKRMIDIWEKVLGFEVKCLRNYMPYMVKGGAVNCITKCLERSTLNPT